MKPADLLTHYTELSEDLDKAITKFARDDDEGISPGQVAGAAAAGGAAYAGHRAVMSSARNAGPLPAGVAGLRQAYRQAGGSAADLGKNVRHAWRNPRENVVPARSRSKLMRKGPPTPQAIQSVSKSRLIKDPTTTQKAKAAGEVVKSGIKKIIKTFYHDDPSVATQVTALEAELDKALQRFAARN